MNQAGLAAGTHLDLALDPTATGTGDAVYGVTVEVVEDGRLLTLAVGNGSLPDGYRLDRHQIAALVALGWSPPGVVPGGQRVNAVETVLNNEGRHRRTALLIFYTQSDAPGREGIE